MMTSSERQPGPSVPKLRELTALVRRAAAAYERPDLVASLDRLDASLRTGTTRVVVAGDFKRGKSSLTNALVNATVCSTDEARTTARPTIVRYGAETTIRAIHTDEGEETSTDIDASTLFDHQDGGDSDVDRLEVTTKPLGFSRCELVVEAVAEEADLLFSFGQCTLALAGELDAPFEFLQRFGQIQLAGFQFLDQGFEFRQGGFVLGCLFGFGLLAHAEDSGVRCATLTRIPGEENAGSATAGQQPAKGAKPP